MGVRQELIPSTPSVPMLPASRSFEPLPPEEDTGWLLDALQVLIQRRRVIFTVLGLAALGLGAYAVMVPSTRIFEARVQMLVEPESSPPLDVGRPGGVADPEGSYYETQYRLLRSRSLARRTLATLNTKSDDGAPPRTAIDAVPPSSVDAFLRGLTVVHIPDSRLVEVRFQSTDPDYAARAANTHTQAYIRQSVELTLLASHQASNWLSRQLADQRARVESGEAALQRYQQGSGPLETRQSMNTQRLSELNAAVLRARSQRVSKETQFQQVEDARRAGKSPRDLAALLPTPVVQQLALDLSNLQRKEVELSANYGERHPERIKVRDAIAFTENRLEAEVTRAIEVMRREVQAARQDEQKTVGQLEAQAAESSVLGRKSVDYEALKREVANDRALFEKLEQRARELRMSGDYELSNIRIIDAAERPQSPIPDTKWRNLGIGAGGSIVFALLLAFGLHYADQRLRSPEDIKTHLGLPYLGMVPQIPRKAFRSKAAAAAASNGSPNEGAAKQPLARPDLPLPFKEALRDLRTHVLCTPAGRASKILLVASAGMDEGKTLVATNLASGLAQVGHRVLLLDLDLRQPSAHTAFDLPLQPGLSELLSGTARARDSIRPASVRDLWVLPAGRPMANPGDLLGSPAFRQMMHTLTKSFDRIVIDSPPVMAVTDASLVAHEQVGVVFVVSADRTGRRAAQAALERLEAVGARFVGAVLNRVDLKYDGSPYYPHYEKVYGGGEYDHETPHVEQDQTEAKGNAVPATERHS